MSELKSKLEIIEEIAAYYNEDPTRRGFGGSCFYFSEELSESGENKMCAIGLCLKDPESIQRETNGESWGSFHYILDTTTPHLLLKEEYQHDDAGFWTVLQGFHDNADYWDINGLTEIGELHLSRLKKSYG